MHFPKISEHSGKASPHDQADMTVFTPADAGIWIFYHPNKISQPDHPRHMQGKRDILLR